MAKMHVFFNKRRRSLYKRNPDAFDHDKLSPTENGDEDEGDFQSPSGGAHVDNFDVDNEVDPPEWELGIRKSSTARSSNIEDLTLSDIILDPDGNITYYWLGLVTLAVVYNIAVIVLRTAFKEMREPAIQDSLFCILDTIGDLIFVLDIFVHCRVSFYEDGCLVLDPVRIVGRYTKSKKFMLDLAAILPVGTIYSCIDGLGGIVYIDISEYFAGDVHVMVVRILRLLKYRAMIKFFDLTDSRTRNPNLVRASKLSLNLWVVIHWIGCFYYMMSEYEGLGTNEWVYPNGTEFTPFSRKYIRVMYWSLMTLTTIGERPAPVTDLEFVFTGLTFLIGVFVFAAVVGNVGDVISNMNAARQEFQGRMDQIKSYLQHRQVDEKLQNRVKRWADYTWTRTQAIDEPALLQMLPDRLRTEIAINVHLETLKKVKIFEECEEGLLRELVLKLRPQVYSPGDYICRIGEIGREMYIVNHGKVEILLPNTLTGRRTVIATLNPGNYFGEISLLKLDDGQNRRTADVKAIGYSELLRLSRRDLMSALVEYPNAKNILEQQAKVRMQKTKLVRRRSNVDFDGPSDAGPCSEPPMKKKDILLQVIKSANFQKLMASKNSDILKDLRNVLDELKQFDSQTTKEKIGMLTKENEDMQRILKLKNEELDQVKAKLENVLSKVNAKSPRARSHTFNCPIRETRHRQCPETLYASYDNDVTPRNSVAIHSSRENNRHTPDLCDNGLPHIPADHRGKSSIPCKKYRDEKFVHDSFTDQSVCLSQESTSKSKKRLFGKRIINDNIKHMSKCVSIIHREGSKCKCHSLRYSFSVPEMLEVNNKVSDNTKHAKIDMNGNKHEQAPVKTVPDITTTSAPETFSDNETDLNQAQKKVENTERELKVMETLLTLDPNAYLSDTSIHTSDENSDDNSELDFDININNT